MAEEEEDLDELEEPEELPGVDAFDGTTGDCVSPKRELPLHESDAEEEEEEGEAGDIGREEPRCSGDALTETAGENGAEEEEEETAEGEEDDDDDEAGEAEEETGVNADDDDD